MKKSLVILTLGALAQTSAAWAAVPPMPQMPAPPPMPAPQISGVKAAVLIDVNSDQVLLNQNGQAVLNPSGLVKLMTAYLLFQAEAQKMLTPGQTVTVSTDAWHAQGSRMFIQPGLPVTVDQLTHGLLIDGGNDAALAIAQSVAGSVGGFVDLMNREAEQMGLKHTHFANPDGLPAPQQHATALDIARLAQALIQKYPQVQEIAGQPSYRYNRITQYNYNPLAGQKGITGLGVGLAAANSWDLAVSARKNGQALVAVVLGASSRTAAGSDASALLHYGFHAWRNQTLHPAGAVVAQIHNPDWSPETLQVAVPQAVTVASPYPSRGGVQDHFVPRPGLAAPIRAGAPVGTLALVAQGKTLKSVPVVAHNAIAQAGWFGRLWHKVQSWL